MFTLKVIDDETTGCFRADTLHEYGGTDVLQAHAFAHLFPGGKCHWGFRELLFAMADIHGWEVTVRKVKDENGDLMGADNQQKETP